MTNKLVELTDLGFSQCFQQPDRLHTGNNYEHHYRRLILLISPHLVCNPKHIAEERSLFNGII